MNPHALREHLEAVPFAPFRIHMTDGKHFDITHPDLAMLTRIKLIVGVGPTAGKLFDHVEHCAQFSRPKRWTKNF